MPRAKKFKLSEEVYTLREFIDVFSRHLPVTFYITEGWMGRNEEQTFSSDEIYRIGAVKRQRRIVTEHGSGYYVSIPVGTRKKVDLFYPDGTVERSVSMEDVPKAMKSHPRNTVSLMFENDMPVSFSFGPDMGANVNLGKMVIVDVYDERYLVGHSIINGKLIDRKIPISIPIYMDLRVAPVVGLVGGTDEDFHVLLADIEKHMTGAVTEVDVTEEIMLFPRDITSSDYEYVNPMATFAKPTSWSQPALTMMHSAAYPGEMPPEKSSWKHVVMELSQNMSKSQKSASSVQPESKKDGRTRVAVTPPARRPQSVVLPTRSRVASLDVNAPPAANLVGVAAAAGGRDSMTNRHAKERDPPNEVTRNTSATRSLDRRQTKTKTDAQHDLCTLTVVQLTDRLRSLKIPDPCVTALVNSDVDGELLASLDEKILTDEFQFSRFNAIKLMKHVREGYFPTF